VRRRPTASAGEAAGRKPRISALSKLPDQQGPLQIDTRHPLERRRLPRDRIDPSGGRASRLRRLQQSGTRKQRAFARHVSMGPFDPKRPSRWAVQGTFKRGPTLSDPCSNKRYGHEVYGHGFSCVPGSCCNSRHRDAYRCAQRRAFGLDTRGYGLRTRMDTGTLRSLSSYGWPGAGGWRRSRSGGWRLRSSLRVRPSLLVAGGRARLQLRLFGRDERGRRARPAASIHSSGSREVISSVAHHCRG
jgi:hypothetical protein